MLTEGDLLLFNAVLGGNFSNQMMSSTPTIEWNLVKKTTALIAFTHPNQ